MGVIIKQSIKSTIINYVGAFIGFLTTMFVVTKFLSPEDVGLTAVIHEIAILFSALALLGTSSSILRFFPYFKDKEKNHNGFFFYITVLPLIGCAIFIPLYILLKNPIAAFFSEKSSLFISYFYWVVPLIFFLTYTQVFISYSNSNMRIAFPKFIQELLPRLLLPIIYTLYGIHLINRNGLVSLYVAVYGISMVALLLYIIKTAPTSFKHDNSFINPPLRKDITRYTLYLLVGALGTTILSKLDIFMVTSQMGLDYTGVFRIAFYFSAVIEIPARSIVAISSPIAAAALKNGDLEEANKLYKKVSLHQLLIGGMIFVMVWSNIDNIYSIIPNGEIYALGKGVVLFLGMAKLIEITLNFGGVLISFSKYYYWSLFLTFILIGLGILTNSWLIPLLGISGASIATFITVIIACSFQQWIVLKKIKGNPFTGGTFITLGLIVVLIGINYLLPVISNPWIDGIYRTFILSALAVVSVFVLKISPEFNNIVLTVWDKMKRK